MRFSPGIHPLLPQVLRSYHPLRVTSHTPPEQNPLCSRQTSLSQMPQTILPHPPLGVQLSFARGSRVLRGLSRSPGNPPTHTQAGSPYCPLLMDQQQCQVLPQRQLMPTSHYLPQLIKSKMRRCGAILVLAGVRGRCSHNSITNTSWLTATMRRH